MWFTKMNRNVEITFVRQTEHLPIGWIHAIFHKTGQFSFTRSCIISLQFVISMLETSTENGSSKIIYTNLQGICARILPTDHVAIIGPQHHEWSPQLSGHRRVRWHQTHFDQLWFEYGPSESRLNHIRSIQTIHTVYTKHSILITDRAFLITPMES